MSVHDEIVAGLVDPQIVSCERRAERLVLRVDPLDTRGIWQAALVAGIAADVEPTIERYDVLLARPDDGREFDHGAALYLHSHGSFDTLPDEEIEAALGPVTFHRPLGRVAVERRLVVDGPSEAMNHTQDTKLVGEGFYTEWIDTDGELIRAWGYSTRRFMGVGRWGERYAQYGRRGVFG